MSLIEFIGFIISVTAMIFLLVRRAWEERHRRKHPEEFKDEQQRQEQTLKQFLKSLDIDMEDEEEFSPPPKPRVEQPVEPPPPPHEMQAQAKPKPHRLLQEDEYRFRDKIESYHPESKIEKRKLKIRIDDRYKGFTGEHIVSPELSEKPEVYHAIEKLKSSRARRLVTQLHSRKDMIVYQEIMNPPISMRQMPEFPPTKAQSHKG